MVVLKGPAIGMASIEFISSNNLYTSPPHLFFSFFLFFFFCLRRRHKHQQPKFWFSRCKRASSMKMTISTRHNHVLLSKFRSTKMGPKTDVCFESWSTFWWPPSSLNYPTSSSCMHGGIYFWLYIVLRVMAWWVCLWIISCKLIIIIICTHQYYHNNTHI